MKAIVQEGYGSPDALKLREVEMPAAGDDGVLVEVPAFCVSWAAVTLLAYVLYRVELVGKRLHTDLRELREALE